MNCQIVDLKDKAGKDEEARYQQVISQLETERAALEAARAELGATVVRADALAGERDKLAFICSTSEAGIVSLQKAVKI